MDNGDFECKCGTVLEHVPDDYAALYCPACEPEKEGIKENGEMSGCTVDIRIRQVENGFTVYDSPLERHGNTRNEFVFTTMKALFIHLEKCFNPLQGASG